MKMKKVLSSILAVSFVCSMVGSSACFAHAPTAAELGVQQNGVETHVYTNVDANASEPPSYEEFLKSEGSTTSLPQSTEVGTPTYVDPYANASAPPMPVEETSSVSSVQAEQLKLPSGEEGGKPLYPDLDMPQATNDASKVDAATQTEDASTQTEDVLDSTEKLESDKQSETTDVREDAKPGFFTRVKNGCSAVASAVKATANAASTAVNSTLNVTAIGSAAVGAYGLYGIGTAISAHHNIAVAAGALLAGVSVINAGWSIGEYVHNEFHKFSQGTDLPEVANRNRCQRFADNIVKPVLKMGVGVAFIGGLSVAPITTLKFVSPLIASAVVKNRLDKYLGKSFINSHIATALGVGFGIIVEPVSTCAVIAARLFGDTALVNYLSK